MIAISNHEPNPVCEREREREKERNKSHTNEEGKSSTMTDVIKNEEC